VSLSVDDSVLLMLDYVVVFYRPNASVSSVQIHASASLEAVPTAH